MCVVCHVKGPMLFVLRMLEGCSGMVGLAVVVFAVCCWLGCMVLEYLVSDGADCSCVVVLEGVVDLSILVLAVKVIF